MSYSWSSKSLQSTGSTKFNSTWKQKPAPDGQNRNKRNNGQLWKCGLLICASMALHPFDGNFLSLRRLRLRKSAKTVVSFCVTIGWLAKSSDEADGCGVQQTSVLTFPLFEDLFTFSRRSQDNFGLTQEKMPLQIKSPSHFTWWTKKKPQKKQ